MFTFKCFWGHSVHFWLIANDSIIICMLSWRNVNVLTFGNKWLFSLIREDPCIVVWFFLNIHLFCIMLVTSANKSLIIRVPAFMVHTAAFVKNKLWMRMLDHKMVRPNNGDGIQNPGSLVQKKKKSNAERQWHHLGVGEDDDQPRLVEKWVRIRAGSFVFHADLTSSPPLQICKV